MLEYNNAASYNSNLKTDFKTNPFGRKKETSVILAEKKISTNFDINFELA